MSIPSKRFEFLSQETNIGTSDFLDTNSSDIFNSVNNSFTGITADLEGFITNFFQSDKTTTDSTSTDSLGVERVVNTISGGIRDLSALNTRDLDNAIAGVIPNPTLQSAFKQISSRCKNKAMSPFGYGKPFDMSMDCGGGSSINSAGGGCNTAQFSDLLSKLSGGAYNRSYNDINSLMNNLLALSNYGFNMNMCGAFGALLNSTNFSSLPTNSVSRAASVLLSSVNSVGNTLGALDIANVSQTRNLTPLSENPNGIINMFSNYNTPFKTKDTGLSNMSDRILGAATIFDSKWDRSTYDNKLSTVNLGTYNKQFDKTLTSRVMNNIGDENSLDSIFNDDTTLLKVAYSKAA